MPLPRLLALPLLILLPLAVPAHAADSELDELAGKLGNEWRPVKTDQSRDIRTWAKLEDGKRYRSFKIEATLDATLDTVARVLFDFANYPHWFWQVREARLLKAVSPTEHYAYIVHDAPLNLPDRDVILHTTIEPVTASRPYALLKTTAAADYIPPRPPYVRMPHEEMEVRFTPLASGRVRMEVEGYVDPGGSAPVWATNFVQRSAPYAIAVGMRRMVMLPEYRDSREKPLFPLSTLPVL